LALACVFVTAFLTLGAGAFGLAVTFAFVLRGALAGFFVSTFFDAIKAGAFFLALAAASFSFGHRLFAADEFGSATLTALFHDDDETAFRATE
jgi:hypothetical protein